MIQGTIKVHQVAYVRGNRIESVICLTRSLNRAHLALLDEVKKAAPAIIDDVFHALADEDVDNLSVDIAEDDGAGELIIQLFSWEEEIR